MNKEEIKAVIELIEEVKNQRPISNPILVSGFQLGSLVKIKKEFQYSVEDAVEFNIVGITEYINGEKWYMLTRDTFENAIPLQYKENQLELW